MPKVGELTQALQGARQWLEVVGRDKLRAQHCYEHASAWLALCVCGKRLP